MALRIGKKKESAGNPPAKIKSRPFKTSKGSKFILFIGDEGAILVYLKGSVVQSRQFIPDASLPNLQELKQTILNEPSAPLMMVVDSMDQSYVQQTLPPVSALSVNKLIKRRLDRDFGTSDIKGAVLLGREKTGRKDWNFMMVSLEKSPQLAVWLDFVEELPNHFLGIRLVSLETETLLKHLEHAMGVSKEGTGAAWKFFVSHNKVGGFRQVILHNGRMIFTRLAQPIGDSNAEVIAGSIEQEMLSTIEYMKRLSFTAQAGLDVYIVASTAIKETIDASKFNASSVHILTPYEIAQYLGIEGATQPTDQFGDVILAAGIGCLRKHILTLSTTKTKTLDQYYNFITYQRAAAILAAIGIIGYAGYIGYEIYALGLRSDEFEQRKVTLQRGFDLLKKEVSESNINVEKANDLIDLYKLLEEEQLSPLPFLLALKPAIHPAVLVKSIEWELDSGKEDARSRPPPTMPGSTPAVTPVQPAALPGQKMKVTLQLEFPEMVNDRPKFAIVSKKVLEDFKRIFAPPFQVQYADLSKVEGESMDFTIGAETEQEAQANLGKIPEAKLIIKGPIMKDKVIKELPKTTP